MRGTWQTTSGGGSGGAGTAAMALAAFVAIVAVAPLIIAAVVAIVKALVIGAVVVTVAAVVAWRLRSRRPVRELPVRRPLPQVQARVLPAQAQVPAIENHYHFYGMTADDVAEALARRQEQS